MPIRDEDPILDEYTERDLAKGLFNLVWDLLERPSRTIDEDELMVNAAHARRSLALCEQHEIGDFDLAFAYEALSRAHMVAGDAPEASRFAAIARVAADRIEDAEDREVFLGDLADLPLSR